MPPFLEPTLIPLGQLKLLPGNPKRHDLPYIKARIRDRGFLHRLIVNRPTMHVLGGNGRDEGLMDLFKEAPDEPPDGIDLDDVGEWLIPCDLVEVPVEVELPISFELNKASERGGWDEKAVNDAIASMPKEEAVKAGFAPDMVTLIQAMHSSAEDDPEEWDDLIEDSAARVPTTPEAKGEDKSVLRYVVRTDVLKLFRSALKQAMKLDHVHDADQAIEFVASEFIALYAEQPDG